MTPFTRTLLTALSLGLAVLPAAAQAAAPKLSVTVEQRGGAGLKPVSFFDIHARAGASRAAGRIVLTNRDEHPVVVDIDRVDAQTASNLGSAYDVRTLNRAGPTRWTRTSRRKLRIAAGRKASFAVSVRVPAGQRPGEYLSGVAIEARGQRKSPGAKSRVAIVGGQRYVIGLQVNVPGKARPALRFGKARVERQPAGVTFLLPLRNSGNQILKQVRGRVEVFRAGRRVATQPIGPGTFVSGTAIDFSVPAARERPPEGTPYRVRASVRYAGRVAKLDDEVTFGAAQAERQEQYGGPAHAAGQPWLWLWAAIGAAVVMLAVGLLLLARRRGRHCRERAL